MTKLIARILSVAALMAMAMPAVAVDAAASGSSGLSTALEVVGIGNPHPVRQISASDQSREEERRRVEISNWEKLFGRQLFPAMGVGNHAR